MTTGADTTASDLAARFLGRFRSRPRLFRAPGRVNLIGEHTDHSGGFVMPAAIQLATWVAIAPRDDRRIVVYSEAVDETATIDLSGPLQPRHRWTDYVAGVADVMQEMGCQVRGANIQISSTVPRGAGLSSSAALEVAAAYGWLSMGGTLPDLVTLATWCQRAENEFVGARCGIMDQYIACLGQAHHALLIDCRSLEGRPVPLPSDINIVVCNTMVKHSIARGEYNRRRADCETAASVLAERLPHVRTLRDVAPGDLHEHGSALPTNALKRARHVVTENARVLEAATLVERGDLARVGELMAQSHRSLRDDYEVSCAELEVMVNLAAAHPGVAGTRMTGAGFGGCTVSLVAAQETDRFVDTVQRGYTRATGIRPDVWVCVASGGVEEITIAQ